MRTGKRRPTGRSGRRGRNELPYVSQGKVCFVGYFRGAGYVVMALCDGDNLMKTSVIYLASPYRGRDEWAVWTNIVSAHIAAKQIWNKGHACISPVSNTAFMGEMDDFNKWMRGDLEILSRCDAICLNFGWEKSEGCRMEYSKAIELGMPIYYGPDSVPDITGR